jgi:hypothetical protein
MKIGTFVAFLVFLSCFNVNECHRTLLQVRIEVQLGTRGDNDAKRLAQPQWSDIPAIILACSVRHMHMVYVHL